MGWGQLTGKLMPRLYSPSVVGFYEQLWAADGARHLRDLVAHGYYGVLPPGDSYADDLPIRFIRSAEMNGDLDVDLDDCPFVEEQYYIKKAQVQKDDVLLAVKGATIASRKCVAHVREDVGQAIVNGSIYRMQVKPEVNPRFLAIVLSTELLKRQMRLALTANNGVDYLDKSLIHHLVVPTPEKAVQDKLVAIYDGAMVASVSAKQEAAALLASIDDYLLSELGIVLPPETENTLANRTFRVSAHELGGWRFDPTFFSKKYVDLTDALEGNTHRRLGEVCTLSNENWDQTSLFADTFPYLEISEIDIGTGTIGTVAETPISEAPSRARMIIRQDDILVSTTRPSRGAITLADESLRYPIIASTGFAVIRKVAASLIEREYLFYLLRSKIGLWQMEQRSSGGNYPAITPTELKRLIIPTPDLDSQRQLVAGCKQRISDALALRQKATAELETAKRAIEAILLGGAV